MVMFNNNIIISILLILFSGVIFAGNNSNNESLKINQDGIKVYTFQTNHSDIVTFKAITYINAPTDSILAVMLDNEACEEWVHACEESILIKSINFNERYHYQIHDVPYPFTNRDFIFHSIMRHDPVTKTISITMTSDMDYCHKNESDLCQNYKETELVRVTKSLGQYTLEPVDKGTKITWVQHTDPGGNLPAWLINHCLSKTPYLTLKNLAHKVKEEKYKNAELIYNSQGIAIELKIPQQIDSSISSSVARNYRLLEFTYK